MPRRKNVSESNRDESSNRRNQTNSRKKLRTSDTSSSGSLNVTRDSQITNSDLKTNSNDKNNSESVESKSVMQNRLGRKFFDIPCVTLAKRLLGKKLVRVMKNGMRISGVITETESYLGGEDKASHSYQGKRTERNTAMFMQPGTSYVYNTYGMYTCMNISSQGDGAAVLLRALDPVEGLDQMRAARGAKKADGGKSLKEHHLCNGPAKLTMSLDLTKANSDQVDLVTCDHLWLEDGEDVEDSDIVISTRIGIESSGEWSKKPLRFYVRGNPSVSVRDKKAEEVTVNSTDDR